MFPASCTAGGTCMGFPDVCLTPAPPSPSPIPIPYPNTGQVTMVIPTTGSTKVLIGNMPGVTVNSEFPMSNGDEPGVSGGVMSGQFIGPGKFKMGSQKVKYEGKAACYLTSMVGQNGSNANVPAGVQIAPSQVKVLILG